MIIDEAPGKQEDLEGVPFCGPTFFRMSKFKTEIGLVYGDFTLTPITAIGMRS
jgi:uracil-DNA glycosylase